VPLGLNLLLESALQAIDLEQIEESFIKENGT
jgi:hypothetical protein